MLIWTIRFASDSWPEIDYTYILSPRAVEKNLRALGVRKIFFQLHEGGFGEKKRRQTNRRRVHLVAALVFASAVRSAGQRP